MLQRVTMLKLLQMGAVLLLASDFRKLPQGHVTAEQKNQSSEPSPINHYRLDLRQFLSYKDITSHMKFLRRNCCPAGWECRVYSVADNTTTEDRMSLAIDMFKGDTKTSGRKTIWIGANIAGVDWLSTAVAMKMLHYLFHMRNDATSRLFEKYDWMIAPLLNPDGYEYSKTTERNWRLNRRPINATCVGVNLKYNFDFRWGIPVVYNPHLACDKTKHRYYCGPSPASEVEVHGIQDMARLYGHRLIAWISLDDYPGNDNGTYWAFPYGSTINHTNTVNKASCEKLEDDQDLREVASAAANSIKTTLNHTYCPGTYCECGVPENGIEIDYIKVVRKVKYVHRVGVFSKIKGDKRKTYNTSDIQPSFLKIQNALVAMISAIEARA